MRIKFVLPRAIVPAVVIVCCAGLTWCDATAHAGDHFLTIGGGASAATNQVSLEKNVLYLQHFLADRGMGDLPHEILFSDGNAGNRDLQYIDPAFKPPRVNELLGEIFHMDDALDTQYRAHAIPHLWGPSGRQSIARWFDTIGAKLSEDDRLIIYFTGHGGRGKPPRGSTLTMWNEPGMSVKEFTRLLDRLPQKVPVVLVMVQCYSGGFADVIYNDADPFKGLSPRNRCGFFATVSDRVAAGCTPDVDEENYHEYSTSFWAALYGRKRTGESVPPPDYNGDGRVSLAEAHAYALIESDTIDISIKTSDTFLRQYSTMKPHGQTTNLIDADSPYDRLLKLAAAPERATLAGLSGRLKLDGANRTQAARAMAERIRRQRADLEARKQKLRQSRDVLCSGLQARVKERWPELSNLLNPAAMKAIAGEGDAIVRAIETSPQYNELQQQDDRLNAIEDELTELERKWVKCQRFIRTAENVALAENLALVASPAVRERYARLVAAEGGVLVAPK
jgi:hypothetical protein